MRNIKKHIDSTTAGKYLDGFEKFNDAVLSEIKKDIQDNVFNPKEATICVNVDEKIVYGAEILKAIVDLNCDMMFNIWKLEHNDSEFKKTTFLKTRSKYYASTTMFNQHAFIRKYLHGTLADNIVEEKPSEPVEIIPEAPGTEESPVKEIPAVSIEPEAEQIVD